MTILNLYVLQFIKYLVLTSRLLLITHFTGSVKRLFLLTFNSYFNQTATENIIMVLTSAKVREEKELFNAAFIPSVL